MLDHSVVATGRQERARAPVPQMSSSGDDDDEFVDELSREVWEAVTAAFAHALAEHGSPPLALRRESLSVESDGNGHVRTLDATVELRVTGARDGSDALRLRFFYHCRPFDTFCDFEVALEWAQRKGKFTRLASARLGDPVGRGGQQDESHDVQSLNADAVAAMRAALFGRSHARAPASQALSDHGLVQIALAACGADGLPSSLSVDIGHTWEPDEQQEAQGAEPTTWLQHAARAAAGAPASYDHMYRGPAARREKRGREEYGSDDDDEYDDY